MRWQKSVSDLLKELMMIKESPFVIRFGISIEMHISIPARKGRKAEVSASGGLGAVIFMYEVLWRNQLNNQNLVCAAVVGYPKIQRRFSNDHNLTGLMSI